MPTTYILKGITAANGECDHCHRDLARLFRIADADGNEMVVGRKCAMNLTGYNWSIAQAERIQKLADAEVRAAADFGELWEAVKAQSAREGEILHYGGAATEAMIALRDRRWMTDDEAKDFAEKMLAESVSSIG